MSSYPARRVAATVPAGLPAHPASHVPTASSSRAIAGPRPRPALNISAFGAYSPLELWHLLSLDAPTVAAVWTWFVARCAGINLPWVYATSLFVAVWILYSADRLLDCRPLASGLAPDGLEERHLFHARHRRAFAFTIAGAALLLLTLLFSLGAPTLRLYTLLAFALAAWLLLVYTRHPSGQSHSLPKEIAVGPFFAAAIFVPTVAHLSGPVLPLLPPSLLLAALCTLNCLLLFAWEHPSSSPHGTPQPHRTTRWALRRLPSLAFITLIASLLGWIATRLTTAAPHLALIPVACALATLLLLRLHLSRERCRPLLLRAAADAVLLTPVLFLPWLR